MDTFFKYEQLVSILSLHPKYDFVTFHSENKFIAVITKKNRYSAKKCVDLQLVIFSGQTKKYFLNKKKS
jgi:hypothetical protein